MAKPSNPNPSPATRFKEDNAGRPEGSRNKLSLGKSVAHKEGLTKDEVPLAFFLKMQSGKPFQIRVRRPGRDRENPRDKIALVWYYPSIEDMKWGAAMAAPYMHPKLANIEHSGNVSVKHEDFIDKLINEDDGNVTTIEHDPVRN